MAPSSLAWPITDFISKPYKKRYEANLEQYKKDLAVYKAQGGEIGPDDEVKDEDEVVGGTASNQ